MAVFYIGTVVNVTFLLSPEFICIYKLNSRTKDPPMLLVINMFRCYCSYFISYNDDFHFNCCHNVLSALKH